MNTKISQADVGTHGEVEIQKVIDLFTEKVSSTDTSNFHL